MLSKLMKYEFMAMGRVFLPMYGALLAITLVNRLLSLLPARAPMVISTVVAGILIAAIFIITFIFVVQRFRKNLLSYEGYLMMTLPVRTDSLILSKLFVATIFNLVSLILAAFVVIILSGVEFGAVFYGLSNMFVDTPFQNGLLIFQFLILTIFAVFFNTLLLYACMALSMLVNKHRGLFSFGAFVVITTVLQILTSLVIVLGIAFPGAEQAINNFLNGLGNFAAGQVMMVFLMAGVLLGSAVFYFVTRYMLKRRLNLQ